MFTVKRKYDNTLRKEHILDYHPDEYAFIHNGRAGMLMTTFQRYALTYDGFCWNWGEGHWMEPMWTGYSWKIDSTFSVVLAHGMAHAWLTPPKDEDRKRVVFIDGNRDNINKDNIAWSYNNSYMIGNVYSRLTVIDEVDAIHAKCQCSCGNISTHERGDLISGDSSSCGCYAKEMLVINSTTHGYSKHKLYDGFRCMLHRCYDPEHLSYPDYGKKKITVCEAWRDYQKPEAYIKWAEENGWKYGRKIHRLNNKGNYCPENCIVMKDKTHVALHTHMRALGVDKLTRKEVEIFILSYEKTNK